MLSPDGATGAPEGARGWGATPQAAPEALAPGRLMQGEGEVNVSVYPRTSSDLSGWGGTKEIFGMTEPLAL